jgi:hypothetical protein
MLPFAQRRASLLASSTAKRPPHLAFSNYWKTRLNSEAQELVATIERVQSALAANDRARLDGLLCPDFHAAAQTLDPTINPQRFLSESPKPRTRQP